MHIKIYIQICIDTKYLHKHMYMSIKQKSQMKFESYRVLGKPLPSSPVVTEYWNGLGLWDDLSLFSDKSSH